MDEDLQNRLARYARYDRVNRPYLEWQIETFRHSLGRRILEIGCGVGSLLDLLGPREAILGVDVEKDVLEYARARFANRAEMTFVHGDLGDPELERTLAAFAPDTLLCINVLEHVRDDLAALQRLERVLAPGGSLCLLVPAHFALYGAYDRSDGHFRRYSKAHLRVLLSHTNLRCLRLRYFNAVGAAGWWVQYKLLRREVHAEAQFGLMNRLVPVFRRVERVLPPPFGLSVVALCRRESGVG